MGKEGNPENTISTKFLTLEAPVLTHSPRSVPNLACKCGPMVYSSMPYFIVIGIYYYIGL